MVDWQDETEDSREFLKSLKIDLDDTEVFVFTPKGEVMSLRAGSTPVDFAYAIHTEVGNHCVGAKVNGSIVPLSYQLQVGDRVEVLTQKSAEPLPRLAQHREDALGPQQDPLLLLEDHPLRRHADGPRHARARDAQARAGASPAPSRCGR